MGRVPQSKVRVPPSRFSVPPSRFKRPHIWSWALDDQRRNSQPGLKDPTNFLPKMVANSGEDLFFGLDLKNDFNFRQRPFYFILFFFGQHLISGKNDFNFRRRTFFLVFIKFRQLKYIISTKLFWSRLQKCSLMGTGYQHFWVLFLYQHFWCSLMGTGYQNLSTGLKYQFKYQNLI